VTEANLATTLVHVDLTVADVERSLAFYADTLGLIVLEDCVVEDNDAAFFLSGGTCRKMRMVFLMNPNTRSSMVELIQFLDDDGRGAAAASALRQDVTFAFRVSDLDEVARAMAADGRRPVSDVFRMQLSQLGHAQVVFYRDPDGRLLEFVAFVEGE
jgi:catechol 2,3-dioxygenase-like lactoylglutathione lyase family enzyme